MPSARKACVTPHVAQKARYSAIDGRTTRDSGYKLSQKHRKRIEEAFGWAKTVGGMAQTMYRGVERVRSRFILTMAANNLARLPRLLAALSGETASGAQFRTIARSKRIASTLKLHPILRSAMALTPHRGCRM